MELKQVVHIFAPNVLAGAERVVITGLNGLVKSNLKISIIIIKEMRQPQHADDFISLLDPSINVIVLESNKALDLNLIKNLKNSLKNVDSKSTIIHTHGYKALLVLKLTQSIQNFSVVHTHHGNTSHTIKVKIYEWWALKVMQEIKAVVCVSSAMKKLLEPKLNSNKLFIVENMLSFNNVKEIKNERLKINFKLPLELLYVGRLSPEKGLYHFLNFFKDYSQKSKLRITVIGDGPERANIEDLIKVNQLENVELKGFIKDPTPYFKQAHVLVMPSFTEGLPMTLIEALSSGLPVIATDVGAISSLIMDNKNGLLLPSNDYNLWNKNLNIFIEDVQKLNFYTIEHAEEIETRFSVNNWVEKTINLYQLSLKN